MIVVKIGVYCVVMVNGLCIGDTYFNITDTNNNNTNLVIFYGGIEYGFGVSVGGALELITIQNMMIFPVIFWLCI